MKLLIPAVITLAIVTILPDWSALFALTSMACFGFYHHYRSLGGRWMDDYGRSLVNPGYHLKRSERERLEGLCLKCRAAFIFSVLFATASFVAWVNA